MRGRADDDRSSRSPSRRVVLRQMNMPAARPSSRTPESQLLSAASSRLPIRIAVGGRIMPERSDHPPPKQDLLPLHRDGDASLVVRRRSPGAHAPAWPP